MLVKNHIWQFKFGQLAFVFKLLIFQIYCNCLLGFLFSDELCQQIFEAADRDRICESFGISVAVWPFFLFIHSEKLP